MLTTRVTSGTVEVVYYQQLMDIKTNIQWAEGEHVVYQDNLYRIRPDGLYDRVGAMPREMLAWLHQFSETCLLTYFNKGYLR